MKSYFAKFPTPLLWAIMPLAVSVAPVWAAPAAKPAPKPATATAAPKPAGVAAQVNDEKIMMADLNRLLDSVKKQDVSLQTNTPAATKALTVWRDRILDSLIEKRLLVQEAKKRKIVPAAKDVNEALADFKQSLNVTSDADFEKALKAEGASIQQVRQTITEELAIQELRRQFTADIVVTDAEVAKFYQENIKEFEIPETVHARHILVAVPEKAPPAEKDKAREKAKDLLKQAQAKGADFAKLARENSDDAGSKQEGGELGFFSRDQMVEPFAEAAFKAKVGDVVGPVETQFGFHIIKVEEKEAAHPAPLAEAREFIKSYLLGPKHRDRINQRVEALRAAATIKKYV